MKKAESLSTGALGIPSPWSFSLYKPFWPFSSSIAFVFGTREVTSPHGLVRGEIPHPYLGRILVPTCALPLLVPVRSEGLAYPAKTRALGMADTSTASDPPTVAVAYSAAI